ncbi:hypothetical protein [Alkalinema sp. FACHB-956]|uniref:hypothetical protein n=1 Tax=Alkalinema sp. FACHB-956 TaxID=2692768 RepID=UPI001687CB38|nr:hypothetical protein [Alkalinema sp. FACHB-956]MBD2327777.1 hypothetical protein [Alkalinema sp. FACHB-956]
MSTSSMDSLHQVICANNPFVEFIVRTQDVWGKGFPDEPSLNAHASDAVFKAIEELDNRQRKVAGITLKAEKGLGKSHIISRIRHRIQERGNALFIYTGDYGDFNQIRAEFLKSLALSLKQVGSKNVMQWQELATDLLNDVFKKNFHPYDLQKAIPRKIKENPQWIDNITSQVCVAKPDISNPDLVQAILWTLSPVHAPHAINWLSGKNLPQSKSDSLGLPNSNTEDRASEAFDITCQILDLISNYKSIVICFDQLEGTAINDAGYTKAQVVANLGMDLYNNIQRGVLLTAVYPDIWVHQIRALPSAEAVIDRIGELTIDLKYLNADDVISLVKRRLDVFYSEHQLIPPHALYPLDELTLREKGKQKATARDVLQWCYKNWKVELDKVPPTEKQDNLVELAYRKELAILNPDDFIDDKAKLARALSFGFENLIGKTLEGVHIEAVDTNVAPKAANKGFIDFRILGTENSQTVKIGVAVIQYPVGIGVQAGLSRLIDYQKFDLTRGCLIRTKDISPAAKKAQQLLEQLLQQLGGEWPRFEVDDLIPLLAIRAVFDAREDYDFTEQEIRNFISQNKIAENNPLLLEILSDPSGSKPTNLIDEDADIETLDILSSDVDELTDSLNFGDAA